MSSTSMVVVIEAVLVEVVVVDLQAAGRHRQRQDHHPEAGLPVGVGPAKDAPDTPVVDLAQGEVK